MKLNQVHSLQERNFKRTTEIFVTRDNDFSFMISEKGTPAYWKQFLYDVLAK